MTGDEALAALRRASQRALVHLARAGIEGLKALEAVIDELGQAAKSDRSETGDDGDNGLGDRPVRIEVE